MRSFEVWADEIATPISRGGFVRIKPGKLLISSAGLIQEVSCLPTSALKNRSKKIQREKTIIPGFVDCHTHLVFAGNRADEWNERLKGATYQAIAAKGGGIQSTVRKTRAAKAEDLYKGALERLRQMLRMGTTTVEIKTGYGLSLESELKLLHVIQKLKRKSPQTVLTTFMPAHAKAPEFDSTAEYVDHLISKTLPKVKRGLADFQDVFCEQGYFDEKESLRLLKAGKKIGLMPKVHAHEFGRTGGVKVAAEVGAVSADHLMYMNENDMALLKKFKVVPVVLPGTCFFLGAKKFSPAREMWDRGLPVAIGSDFNPGTNPSFNLPLCGTMAAIHQNLNLDEVLTAQTWHSALALGLKDRGCLEAGMRADFLVLDAQSFEEIYYSYGETNVSSVYIRGKKTY